MCLVLAALPDMFQWNHRRALPPRRGHVRWFRSVGHQSADRNYFLLRGDHHPSTDHTGLQVLSLTLSVTHTHTDRNICFDHTPPSLLLPSNVPFPSSFSALCNLLCLSSTSKQKDLVDARLCPSTTRILPLHVSLECFKCACVHSTRLPICPSHVFLRGLA